MHDFTSYDVADNNSCNTGSRHLLVVIAVSIHDQFPFGDLLNTVTKVTY